MPQFVDVSLDEPKPPKPTPSVSVRPDKGPMPETELQSIFDGLVSSAIQYTDGELSPARATATKYYNGEPFGNEEPGRSQVVITEVRDQVQAVLPSMLKVIFGADRPVEFRPDRADAVGAAEQATDFVYHAFMEDNPGFLETLAVLKDGLIRKQGAYKWWWEKGESSTHKFSKQTTEQMIVLAEDDEVEITRVTPAGEIDGPAVQPGPDQPPAPPSKIPVYDVELTRTTKDGRLVFRSVPPNELCYNREARNKDDAIIILHRTRKSHGELIGMGIDQKEVEEFGTADADDTTNEEVVVRSPSETTGEEEEAGKANEKTRYVEAYVRIDFDGDGIAELRKICSIGTGNHIVMNDPCDEIPFAIYCPDPEPHTMSGQSWADRTMDMQKLKSALMRAGLDSLAASIFPRTWYKQGDANLADVLNTAIGAPIRTQTGVGAVGEFAHTFTGKEAFTALAYCDEIIERRTGSNKGAQGLDADALQSSTRAAVAAAVSASQAQQEMLVRIFAEGPLKDLFRGLLRLFIKHQPRARTIRLRNQWVEVDPRTWNADMDVQVNVTLGSGLTEEKIATLDAISAKQFEIIAQMGPNNPICGLKEARDTLAEMAELRGRKDSTKYFKPITADEEKARAEQAASQPPQDPPEVVIAKAEIEAKKIESQARLQLDEMKTKREFSLKQAEMALKLKEAQMTNAREREKAALEDDRERDKQASDIALKRLDIEMKYKAKVDEHQMKADIEVIRNSLLGPEEQPTAEEAPAPKPAKKRRRVTIERADENDPKSPIRGAVIEDEDE